MKVGEKNYRTVWMEESTVYMIDQNKLPFSFEIVKLKTYKDTCKAIKDMTVRGAGAIGATAGFAMAQALYEAPKGAEFISFIDNARLEIEATRPTAYNLFYATKRVYDAYLISLENGLNEAQLIADEDVASCKLIGEFGNQIIPQKANILTHCNAGWLAFVDYGSAISPIYKARDMGKDIFVYADETRPRSQGARLTAWELFNENIKHAILPDNAAAWYMAQGKIDMVIVGADRITANGDVANKIGTLEKAICANAYNIPFYVAAPSSTFDLNCKSGNDIIIEERSQDEVLFQTGYDASNQLHTIAVTSPGSPAVNPAFDVTPAKYIKGIITEKGIISPNVDSIMSTILKE